LRRRSKSAMRAMLMRGRAVLLCSLLVVLISPPPGCRWPARLLSHAPASAAGSRLETIRSLHRWLWGNPADRSGLFHPTFSVGIINDGRVDDFFAIAPGTIFRDTRRVVNSRWLLLRSSGWPFGPVSAVYFSGDLAGMSSWVEVLGCARRTPATAVRRL